MGKRSSYPLPPSMTLIPAQAGIHDSSGSAPPTTTDLPNYVSLSLEKSRSFYSISQTRDDSLGKLPDQVRKLSSSSQDSGATRVDHIRFENLTKEIHRMQARAKAPQRMVTRTRGSSKRITDDRVRYSVEEQGDKDFHRALLK